MGEVPLCTSYQDAAMLARCGIPSSHPTLTFPRRDSQSRCGPVRGGPVSPEEGPWSRPRRVLKPCPRFAPGVWGLGFELWGLLCCVVFAV